MKLSTTAFLFLGLLLTACKEQIVFEESTRTTSVKHTLVETAPVSLSSDPIPLYSIGRAASDKEVKLSFKVGGLITNINADEGDYIKEGTLLASIRTDEIDAQVYKAERAIEKARRDLVRIEAMFKDSIATQENVDDLRTLVSVNQSDLDIAKFNQQYAKIVSPVSGRVIRRLAEPNELINPGQPIFVLSTNKGATVVKASLSDRDISRINYHDKAQILFDAFPGDTITGSVSQIAESSDPMTGTFDVDIKVRAGSKRIRNGYIGRVIFHPNQSQSYYKIPIGAIVEGYEEYLNIFTPSLQDSTVTELTVKPFQITSEYIAVYREGLPEIKTVVTKGAPYLKDMDTIRIKS